MPKTQPTSAAGGPASSSLPVVTLPSQLPNVLGEVSCDTETSGLFADDGARTSTVSIAWWEHIGCSQAEFGSWAAALEVCTDPEWVFCESDDCVQSAAFPFDQGAEGKPEDNGQSSLFSSDVNLPESEWKALLSWLSVRPLVFHNAPFDLEKLRVGTRTWPGVELEHAFWWDTQTGCKELWPLSGTTSLKPTAERLWPGTGMREYEQRIKTYLSRNRIAPGRYDLIPWDILGPYADMDARQTLRLRARQARVLWEGSGVPSWCHREFLLGKILYRMTRRGVPYDAPASLAAANQIQGLRADLARTLPFVPNTPAAKKYFFGVGRTAKGQPCLGLTPYAVTEKNQEPQLTAEILDRMVKAEVPHAADYASWSQLETAESMWYRGYAEKIGSDGRLRAYFRQTKVVSGRYSAERVQLHAIPHDYRLSAYSLLAGIPTPRKLITSAVARLPGWGLWELDWAQAELRAAAVTAGCTRMLEAFQAGTDLHGYTATELFHVEPSSDRWPLIRQVGKRANFTLCFGAGWPTFQAMVRKETGVLIEDSEADRIVTDWNGLYPEYGRASRKWARKADIDRRVQLVNGHQRWFRDGEFTHKAFNQYIQASLAELGKDLMIEVESRMERAGIPELGVSSGIGEAGMLLTVHDSVLLLLPDDRAASLVAEICAWGSDYGSRMFNVPMALEGKRWS